MSPAVILFTSGRGGGCCARWVFLAGSSVLDVITHSSPSPGLAGPAAGRSGGETRISPLQGSLHEGRLAGKGACRVPQISHSAITAGFHSRAQFRHVQSLNEGRRAAFRCSTAQNQQYLAVILNNTRGETQLDLSLNQTTEPRGNVFACRCREFGDGQKGRRLNCCGLLK